MLSLKFAMTKLSMLLPSKILNKTNLRLLIKRVHVHRILIIIMSINLCSSVQKWVSMLFPISSSIMHSHFFRACKIIYSSPVVVRDANWTVDGLSPYLKIPNPSNRLKIHKHIFINISEFTQINISCDIKLKIFYAYVIF